jgi:integrase
MAGDRRYVDKNIFDEMKELKVDEKVVRFMSQEEIVRLFDVVQASQTRYARRFEIYLRILFLTGGRRTETLMLKVGQLDMEGRYLTFDKTKTDDFRVIPMNEQLQKLLTEYLKQHPELEPESWLFDVRKPTSMSRAFSRYRKKAGLPESITLHSTRHTVGALHRLMGTPLADIRDLFGHKHLTTTNIYTKMLPENLRPVVAKMDLDGLLQRTRDKMKQRQEPTQVVDAQVIETRQLEAPKDPI